MPIVRQSKVRHVYGESKKYQDQWTNINLSPLAGDQQHIKANDHFIAAPISNRRGSVAILDISKPHKVPPQLPLLDGHKGKTIDFDFSPFSDNFISTGGEDAVIKCWQIPADGLKESVTESIIDLAGHQKKITSLRYHPSASGVIASGSADHNLKVWDVMNSECSFSFTAAEAIQDINWSPSGSLLSASSKDKLLILLDPRSKKTICSFQAHDGGKPSKSIFLDSDESFATVGFSKNSTRSYKLWDSRKLDKPTVMCKIDQSAGTLLPFYDSSLRILYIVGKGDSNIRYYELIDSEPYQYKISDFRATKPTKGICMLPKRNVDVMKHEVDLFMRLTNDTIEPVSFICPRKAEHFLADLYPDCPSPFPATTAEGYFGSKTTFNPKLQSLDPAISGQVEKIKPTTTVIKSRKQLEAEVEQYKLYVNVLTEKLKELGQTIPDTPKGFK